MKLIANTLSILTLISFISLLSGCGSEPVKPSAENVKATRAQSVLEEMRKAYIDRDVDGVLSHVSPSLEGGYSGFASSMRKDTETYDRVELTLTVERVEIASDEVRVVFHWYGKWWDEGGKLTEGRGNTVYTFTDEGEMPLIKAIGDNPFGVVR